MLNTNFARNTALLLLLITYMSCLHFQVDAAKITKRGSNTSAIITNTSNTVDESKVAATVIAMPTATPIAPIAETKENIKEDMIEYMNKKADREDGDDDEDDDDDDNDDEDEEDDDNADVDENETKSETVLEAAEKDEDTTTSFSVWGIVRTMWNWVKDDISESIFGDDDDTNAAGVTKSLVRQVRSVANAAKMAVESRTFGKIRRLQMALIPLIFKFGVLTAMVAFLIMLGMKTLFLVKLLVLMNAAAILAKFITLKSNFIGHEEHHAPAWNYQTWTPPAGGGWVATAPAAPHSYGHEHAPSKEIHLHIHGGHVQGYGAGGQGVVSAGHGWESRSDPYGAYAVTHDNEVNNELNNLGPIDMLPTRYPNKPRY